MTTTTVASNGSTGTTDSDATGQKDRPFGMAVIRESETYHNASTLHDAVFEAEKLASAVQRAVSDARYRDVRKPTATDTGLNSTQTAESPQMQAKLREALNCLQSAQDYVNRLLVDTYTYDTGGSPF
jgi:hypothetical protein